MKENNNEKNITPQELFDIMLGVEKLRKFYKAHPFLYFRLARCNGKTLNSMRFIRQYAAIIKAYAKADRKAAKADRKAYRKEKKAQKRASCGTTGHHVIFDETFHNRLWTTEICWRCASPIYQRKDARVHNVDGDRSRKVIVCAGCHMKLHEKTREERKQ